jgi:hypothetical protein
MSSEITARRAQRELDESYKIENDLQKNQQILLGIGYAILAVAEVLWEKLK